MILSIILFIIVNIIDKFLYVRPIVISNVRVKTKINKGQSNKH